MCVCVCGATGHQAFSPPLSPSSSPLKPAGRDTAVFATDTVVLSTEPKPPITSRIASSIKAMVQGTVPCLAMHSQVLDDDILNAGDIVVKVSDGKNGAKSTNSSNSKGKERDAAVAGFVSPVTWSATIFAEGGTPSGPMCTAETILLPGGVSFHISSKILVNPLVSNTNHVSTRRKRWCG